MKNGISSDNADQNVFWRKLFSSSRHHQTTYGPFSPRLCLLVYCRKDQKIPYLCPINIKWTTLTIRSASFHSWIVGWRSHSPPNKLLSCLTSSTHWLNRGPVSSIKTILWHWNKFIQIPPLSTGKEFVFLLLWSFSLSIICKKLIKACWEANLAHKMRFPLNQAWTNSRTNIHRTKMEAVVM